MGQIDFRFGSNEATHRAIQNLRIHDNPPYGREVHITFTDGTQISIDLEIVSRVKARHYTR